MTAVTRECVRKELRNLNISNLNDPIALTLRFKKQTKWKEPLDEIRAEKNMVHFLKILSRNSKVYGNRAKRFGKILTHWFEFQGDVSRRPTSEYLHLHGFLDYPKDIWATKNHFGFLIFNSWEKHHSHLLQSGVKKAVMFFIPMVGKIISLEPTMLDDTPLPIFTSSRTILLGLGFLMESEHSPKMFLQFPYNLE
jgi:hypothetical protein